MTELKELKVCVSFSAGRRQVGRQVADMSDKFSAQDLSETWSQTCL